MTDSPIILAIDTTTEFGGVAIRRAGKTVAEVKLRSTDGFGNILFQAIQEALDQAGTNVEDIDCFAAASGPGSFTGVRVALSAAKGFAEALQKPAAGISNLRALSRAGHSPLRAVVLDARRKHIYAAVYDAGARLVEEEMVITWDEWVKRVPAGAEFIGLEGGPCGVPFTVASPYLAPAIAACAEMDGPAGWCDPVGLDANYVRSCDAEMAWKDS